MFKAGEAQKRLVDRVDFEIGRELARTRITRTLMSPFMWNAMSRSSEELNYWNKRRSSSGPRIILGGKQPYDSL